MTDYTLGITGSRSLPRTWAEQVRRVVRAAPGAVLVGDAPGADAFARAAALQGALRIFRVDRLDLRSMHHGAFVARSIRMVRALAADPDAHLVAFVDRACPAGIEPGPSWPAGSGSGSWATTALAAGLGIHVSIIWCAPGPFAPPPWPGWRWVQVSIAGVPAWSRIDDPPTAQQLDLF